MLPGCFSTPAVSIIRMFIHATNTIVFVIEQGKFVLLLCSWRGRLYCHRYSHSACLVWARVYGPVAPVLCLDRWRISRMSFQLIRNINLLFRYRTQIHNNNHMMSTFGMKILRFLGTAKIVMVFNIVHMLLGPGTTDKSVRCFAILTIV